MVRRLVVPVLVAAALAAVGCSSEGEAGSICDATEDCNSGLVCVSQVLNCSGESCWGTCERECVTGSDCEGGERCLVAPGGLRVCRPSDFSYPSE